MNHTTEFSPSYLLSTCLVALLSGGCIIEGLPGEDAGSDDTTGEPSTGDTTASPTTAGDTTAGDTTAADTTDGDTTDGDTTDGAPPICPGSEESCAMAESHCDGDGTLQICQLDEELGCIFHASVDCAKVIGGGSMCVEDDETMAGCTAAATAMVRFVNLSDGHTVRFRVGGQEVAGVELSFTQSAHYVELPVGIDVDVEVLDTEGNVLSSSVYPELQADGKYTVAAMGLGQWPETWVSGDLHVDDLDIPVDHTRFTLVNATPDLDNGIYAQLDYPRSFIDFYVEHGNSLLEYVQQVTVDAPLPTPGDVVALVAQWGVPSVYYQVWNADAFMQTANDEALYVFLTCTGTCDSDADRFVLGMHEDSSTFTVEVPGGM